MFGRKNKTDWEHDMLRVDIQNLTNRVEKLESINNHKERTEFINKFNGFIKDNEITDKTVIVIKESYDEYLRQTEIRGDGQTGYVQYKLVGYREEYKDLNIITSKDVRDIEIYFKGE